MAILVATVLPLVSLVWASAVAKGEVEDRAVEGLVATAKATVLQEQQAWDDAVRVVVSAASRPVPLSALQSRDLQLARAGVENILETGPFADVRLYDGAGTLLALAARPGVVPSEPIPAPSRAATYGEPVNVGSGSARQISVGSGPEGRLVVDVDLTQLLGKPADLAFGRTGAKFLVTPAGLVVAGSDRVGTPLRSDVNRAIAAAGKPVAKTIFSPFSGRQTVESYEPIPGQGLGILVQQAESEVMADVDHMVAVLRWAGVVVGVLGMTLAAGLGVFLGRRSRRLAAAEQRLVDSQTAAQRRLQQFVEAIPIGVFVATADGRPHYANREAERLLGRGVVPEAGAETLAEVYDAHLAGSPGLYPAERMPLVRALAGETSHVDDMEIRGSGTTVPIEVWGTPAWAADGSVEFAITAFADVSERRQAAEREQLLGAITANMSEGVILVRLDDRTIAYANPSFESMFGYDPGELDGRPVQLLLPADAALQQTSVAINQSLREHGAWRGEVRNVRKDGTPLWCAVNIAMLDHPRFGSVSIAVHSDITARRQALEVLVEREQQLAAARDLAMEASRLKSEFLANMSHEIRTPMNAVIGMTALLLDTPLEDDQLEYADAVRSAGEALLQIINDILDFSKIEAGKLRLEVVDFEPAAVVGEIADLLAAKAHEKGLELLAHVSGDVPPLLKGDPGRLRQILTNLVGNAVKFADHGEVVVRVEVAGHVDGAASLRFAVSDTGVGISEDGRRQLFQAFEQGDSSPRRRHGGTGLGLAISKQLVEMMGGEIGLRSALGAGSTFWFDVTLPVSDEALPAPVPLLDLGGLRVLVVDDNATSRTMLQQQLTAWGAACTAAGSGSEALEVLRAGGRDEAFDLALLDALMPGMDGFELAELIVADPARRGLRLVMLTSPGAHPERSTPGIAAHLSKPVRGPQLRACIARIMDLAPNAPARAPDRSRPAGGTHSFCAHVLVAEDNYINQVLTVRMLEKLGCRTDVVVTGVEAVEALERTDYDAVLMDCQMPELDGFEATRVIRGRESGRRTPIIALTAAAGEADRERCIEAGMDDYVSKPMRLADLEAVLARCLPAAWAGEAIHVA